VQQVNEHMAVEDSPDFTPLVPSGLDFTQGAEKQVKTAY
jgi:hypothetical protein